MSSLWNAARDTYRRIFGSRPLGAREVYDKLDRVDLGTGIGPFDAHCAEQTGGADGTGTGGIQQVVIAAGNVRGYGNRE